MKKAMVAVLFVIFCSGFVNAGELKLITYNIPMLVVNENEGVFIDLAKEVAKRAGVELKIEVQPLKRAIKSYTDGASDILFPALASYFASDFKLERTEAIFQKRDFIFTLKTNPILTTIKELEGKKVGIVFAAPYSHELLDNKQIKFKRVQTDDLNAKKLVKGRIEATVIEEKSGLDAFKAIKALDKIHYDPTNPVTAQDAFFAFPATDSGKKNAAIFSKALISMKEDGKFGAIMSQIPKE